jgi:hypothetical protein
VAKQRHPKLYKELHKSADYYEPLFRARFVRAMKALQKRTSINHLAMVMANKRQAKAIIPKAQIQLALVPAAKVIKDAVMQGGKIGAKRVQDLG